MKKGLMYFGLVSLVLFVLGLGTANAIYCGVNAFVDIKPMSCPNPLNVKDHGVLSVAILGTADFDVTLIDDPLAVFLVSPQGMEVNAIRYSYEDVATPAEDGCTEDGGDGYLDLVVKFDAQEVISALGDVDDGDVVTLYLIGSVSGVGAVCGDDEVVILKKGK